MRQIKASDFANAFEYENAKRSQRKASKNARNNRTNGRGKAFAINGSDE